MIAIAWESTVRKTSVIAEIRYFLQTAYRLLTHLKSPLFGVPSAGDSEAGVRIGSCLQCNISVTDRYSNIV